MSTVVPFAQAECGQYYTTPSSSKRLRPSSPLQPDLARGGLHPMLQGSNTISGVIDETAIPAPNGALLPHKQLSAPSNNVESHVEDAQTCDMIACAPEDIQTIKYSRNIY